MKQSHPAKEIFADTLEKPEGERADYLRKACAGDTALMADVQELIAAHFPTS